MYIRKFQIPLKLNFEFAVNFDKKKLRSDLNKFSNIRCPYDNIQILITYLCKADSAQPT